MMYTQLNKKIFFIILFFLSISIYSLQETSSLISNILEPLNIHTYSIHYTNESNIDKELKIQLYTQFDTDKKLIYDIQNKLKQELPQSYIRINRIFYLDSDNLEEYYDDTNFPITWHLPNFENDVNLQPILLNNKIALIIPDYNESETSDELKNEIEDKLQCKIQHDFQNSIDFSKIIEIEQSILEYLNNSPIESIINWTLTSRIGPNWHHHRLNLNNDLTKEINNYNTVLESIRSELQYRDLFITITKEIKVFDLNLKPSEEIDDMVNYNLKSLRLSRNSATLRFSADISMNEINHYVDKWILNNTID